jgi:hypothetical protein
VGALVLKSGLMQNKHDSAHPVKDHIHQMLCHIVIAHKLPNSQASHPVEHNDCHLPKVITTSHLQAAHQ